MALRIGPSYLSPRMPSSFMRADMSHPINRGCVGWWPMTNNVGSTAFGLIGGEDGSISGNVAWDIGRLGSCLAFPSGSSDYVSTGVTVTGYDSVTVTGWVLNDEGTTTNDFGKFASTGHAGNFDIYIDKRPANRLFRFDVNSTILTSSNPLPSNVFNFVAFVFEKGVEQSIWVNDVKESAVTPDPNSIAASSHNLWVGNASTPRPWSGNIQNVRVFNRALDDSEVSSLYISPWLGIAAQTPYFYSVQTFNPAWAMNATTVVL